MAIRRTNGKKPSPIRLFLYGDKKIGKSQFCCDIPNACHFDLEHATDHLPVKDRWLMSSWEDFLDAIEHLETTQHKHEAIVIDTSDKLEDMLWEYICERDGLQDIESAGYGKGYKAAAQEMRRAWSRLEYLRERKGMSIIIVGHSEVVTFKSPVTDDYDRMVPKGHKDFIGFLTDQVDAIGYVSMETVMAKPDADARRKKHRFTGARVLHMQPQATFLAGCRYPVPPDIDFTWEAFTAAYSDGASVKPADLLAEINTALDAIGDEKYTDEVRKFLRKKSDDILVLSRCRDKVAVRMAKEMTDANG